MNYLYTGTVYHQRLGHAAHEFRYPALFICFPLAQRAQLKRALFGYNRWNLYGFYDQDHGDGHNLEQWLQRVLHSQGLSEICDGEVWLQTQPRVLGFVFNPVSFWYCHDRQQQLRAIICEVNNTFGERHCYVLTADQHHVINASTELHCHKVFHVSPFFPTHGEYQFRFWQDQTRRSVAINYCCEQQLVLKTVITGTAQPLTNRHLLMALAQLGWTTLLVVLRIHWQALKLWRKGAIFHRKPAPPTLEIST